MSDSLFELKALGILALAALTIKGITSYATRDDYEHVTVKNLYVKNSSSGSGTYMVGTDKGVFKNGDDWAQFKFNSSDVQNSLQIGKKYNIKTNGIRIPFFSRYENILEATPDTVATSPAPVIK
jgi:hypothetical protein